MYNGNKFRRSISLFFVCLVFIPALATSNTIEPLDPIEWSCSEWISVKDAPVISGTVGWSQRSADGASWFVSDIQNEKRIESAKWMTTALGIYDIFVNGELIGEEILKPGFTDYRKTKYSFTYDVTDYFKREEGAINRLSAQVTSGWWADRVITPSGHKGTFGQKCAFRGVLKLTFNDGTTKLYGTDLEHWRAGIAGKVKHAGIYDGEIYDDREKQGFECLESLAEPELNMEFAGEVLPTDGAEIYFRHDLILYPKQGYVYKDIENVSEDNYGKVIVSRNYADNDVMIIQPGETLVVDFGQNCSAVPHFVFKAKEGTKLSCHPGEVLNDGNGAMERGMDGPEGSVHRKNLRIPEKGMYIEYIFSDKEDYVHYIPRYSYFGYRYVAVTADSEVEISHIYSIPISSITENMEVGHIATGDEQINQLLSNTIWSQRSNYLSIPTDCPNRNERLGWLADTQIFCETGSYFADTQKFFHKWMRDVRDSQYQSGAYPVVAPVGCQGDQGMRCGWSDAGVIVPYIIFKQYNDIDIIRDNWDSMERYMAHITESDYDFDSLIAENKGYIFGDWLSYEPLESYSKKYLGEDETILPEAKEYWNYLSQSYWLMDASMMKSMAEAVEDRNSVQKYMGLEQEIKDKIKDRYFTSNGDFKVDILNTMQTPSLFALMNGIFNDESVKTKIIKRLRNNFRERDNCLSTGFLGTSILMHTLTENGMCDIAYELLFQHKNPSWLYSIDNGATTIWERWDSYTIDKGMASSGMNSFNHYAHGSVCEWIWKTCAGISADPSIPGFKHIILKPIPDLRLGFLDAEYRSVAGVIRSAWKYEGDNWDWEFTIPDGTIATVIVPGENSSEVYTAGTYNISVPQTSWNKNIEISENKITITKEGIVEVVKNDNERVYVYNTQGIVVLTTINNSFTLSPFPQGFYIIKIGERVYKIWR